MTQYINKSKVAAEIKRLQGFFVNKCDDFEKGYHHGLDMVLSSLDSMKTKEVNLEKEIKNRIDSLSNLYCYMEDLFNGNEEEGVYPIPEKVTNELFEFAKHFYELGLTQKGE